MKQVHKAALLAQILLVFLGHSRHVQCTQRTKKIPECENYFRVRHPGKSLLNGKTGIEQLQATHDGRFHKAP